MVKFLTVDENELFEEVVERGLQEGIDDYRGYKNLVDDVIEQHRSVGEIHDDSPTEAMEDWIEGRWPQYQERVGGTAESPEA